MVKVIFLATVTFGLSSCGSSFESNNCGFSLRTKDVLLDDLIRHPEDYNGDYVRVAGFYSGYGERSEIFSKLEKSPYDADASDGIDLSKIYRDLHGKKLVVTGRFSGPIDRAPFYGGRLCVIDVNVAE